VLPTPRPSCPTSQPLARKSGGDYTFELRRGVRGPTGDPFTAADVSWSIKRDLATSPVAPFLFSLANLDVRDPVTVLARYAVRINVSGPSPFLLGVLAWFDEGVYDRKLYLAHATGAIPGLSGGAPPTRPRSAPTT